MQFLLQDVGFAPYKIIDKYFGVLGISEYTIIYIKIFGCSENNSPIQLGIPKTQLGLRYLIMKLDYLSAQGDSAPESTIFGISSS